MVEVGRYAEIIKMITYLERVHPSRNIYRSYALQVTQRVFGPWSLVRIGGRIGYQGGASRESWYANQEEAEAASRILQKKKERRGYQSVSLSS